jgi:peptidoglycan/xylan/chitin deacetylase (PgdA/CDA1 family)
VLAVSSAPESGLVGSRVHRGNHAVLTAIGLWPRSTLLGPTSRACRNAVARGEIALTFDDGPDPEVTPRVLDLLDAHGARATFFCIAENARATPSSCARSRAAATWSRTTRASTSSTFAMLGSAASARDRAAQDTLSALTGSRRASSARRGIAQSAARPGAARPGPALVSWTRRGFDTREQRPARVAARLLRGLARGDILLLHDGHSAPHADRRSGGARGAAALLEAARHQGLRPVTLAQAIDP